jgi:DNA-binding IclR family transcriptional regulator
LHASKQSINHLLGQLERFGYLERRDDSEERRLGSKRLTQLQDLLRELAG